MARGHWGPSNASSTGAHFKRDKPAVDIACARFIAEVLKPRFLPEIRPTEFNYCIDIFGKWHGTSYRFMQRYRTDRDDAISPEFDRPFARITYVGSNRFDLAYFRHTEEWNALYRGLSLEEAFETIESQLHFHPL